MQNFDKFPAAGKRCHTPDPSYNNSKVSRTYQHTNIFGFEEKAPRVQTLNTESTPRSIQRPVSTMRNNERPVTMSQVLRQSENDEMFRDRLRKKEDQPFQPHYKDTSPAKRHVTEFHGQDHSLKRGDQAVTNQRRPFMSEAENPGNSPAERKDFERSSSLYQQRNITQQINSKPKTDLISADSDWRDTSTNRKTRDFTSNDKDLSPSEKSSYAQSRKKLEQRSDVFNLNLEKLDSNRVDFAPQPERKIKVANEKDATNEDIRKSQHLFSDLFGHAENKNLVYRKGASPSGKHTPTDRSHTPSRQSQALESNRSALSTKEINTNANYQKEQRTLEQMVIKEKEKENLVLRPSGKEAAPDSLKYNAKDKKVIDVHSTTQHDTNPLSYIRQKAENPVDSNLYDFDLKSIPKDFDMHKLKSIFSGSHVVDLCQDVDHVSGRTNGSGRIKLKAHTTEDVLKIKSKLREQGILMLAHVDRIQKKNNYSGVQGVNWMDPKTEFDRKQKNQNITPQEAKLKNLESEGDVFGNTKGVGKWDRNSVSKPMKNTPSANGEQNTQEDVCRSANWNKAIKSVQNTKNSEIDPLQSFVNLIGLPMKSFDKMKF